MSYNSSLASWSAISLPSKPIWLGIPVIGVMLPDFHNGLARLNISHEFLFIFLITFYVLHCCVAVSESLHVSVVVFVIVVDLLEGQFYSFQFRFRY